MRRTTIEFISTHEINNPLWSAATQRLVELSTRKDVAQRLMALLTPDTPQKLADRHKFAQILNYYEGVAIGIKHRVLSPKIYYDWNAAGYVNTWDLAQAYITQRRRDGHRNDAHIHFEELAKKWMKKGTMPHRSTDRAPAVQHGPPTRANAPPDG